MRESDNIPRVDSLALGKKIPLGESLLVAENPFAEMGLGSTAIGSE